MLFKITIKCTFILQIKKIENIKGEWSWFFMLGFKYYFKGLILWIKRIEKSRMVLSFFFIVEFVLNVILKLNNKIIF